MLQSPEGFRKARVAVRKVVGGCDHRECVVRLSAGRQRVVRPAGRESVGDTGSCAVDLDTTQFCPGESGCDLEVRGKERP